MRKLILLAMFTLVACDSPGIRECEELIKDRLKAPSTYKRISAFSGKGGVGAGRMVQIEYDAANSFGTPLRQTDFCSIPNKGEPTISPSIE